jgi:ABC-type transport system involved in cytochrome c biogenesis permease subunit
VRGSIPSDSPDFSKPLRASPIERRQHQLGIVAISSHLVSHPHDNPSIVHESTWWTRRRLAIATIELVFRLLRRPANASDTFVTTWKKAWIAGAEARWSNGSTSNPYSSEPLRAAWDAGRLWAADNPDRRTTSHVRLAHPLRRSTDTVSRVVRAAEISAIGLGVLAAARWAWRRRHP